jgi:tetratricopeptide (TPR) repeat protein
LCTHIFASATLDLGDKEFVNKNYKKALSHYLNIENKNNIEVKLRIIQTYLRLGDNYFKIKEYNTSLSWYEKARKLESRTAKNKISLVYEKQADDLNKIHKYQEALNLYNKALKLNNTNVTKKIINIKKHFKHQSKLSKDTRVLVQNDSPKWTHAIGRLIIPVKLEILQNKSYRTKQKKCSATLVNLDENKDSSIVITASHCLSAYNNKAGQLKFIIKDKSNKMIYRIANIEFDSNFNLKQMKQKTDFAILSLHKPISSKDVEPIIITKDSFSDLQKKYKNHFGSLGGFSSDIAAYGAKLTFDPKCELKNYSKTYGSSTCKGFNGASGGPIVLTTYNKGKSTFHFVGVVSHFKNKDFTNIYFAPHHLFFNKIEKMITATN